jgi:alkanesulfonate monooxygenase SsuD/methylene tetrahydromethanopterin reductase-like flavin-dependent oxidoreductase (luciferase family)
MSVEFIGIAATAPHSETEIAPAQTDPVPPGCLEELAPIAKVTGAAGNSTALIGSYEQVAQALLRYVGLGVRTLLVRGFTPLAGARDYGTLVRLVREQAGPAVLVSAL